MPDYYLNGAGQVLGPYSEAELAARNLAPDTLVCQEGQESWIPVSSVLALAPAVSGASVPAAQPAEQTPHPKFSTSPVYRRPPARKAPPPPTAARLSAVAFLLGLACFILPMVDLNHAGQRVASVTGLQLVIGIGFDPETGKLRLRNSRPEPAAELAALASMIALFLSLGQSRGRFGVALVLGAVGVVSLVALQLQIDGQCLRGGKFVPAYTPGFWLAIMLFAAGAVLSGIGVGRRRYATSQPPSNPEVAATGRT